MIDYWDASAVAAVILAESTATAVDRHMLQSEAAIAVSDFAVAEVSSAVSRLVRTGEQTVVQATELIDDLDAWVQAVAASTEIVAADIQVATDYVRRFDLKLRAPDAIHAAVCQRLGARLVTLDDGLARTARTLGIDVVFPVVIQD